MLRTMNRILSAFVLLIFFQCSTRFDRKILQYSGILGMFFAQNTPARFVSSDFISNSTLAPVVIAKNRKLGFTMDAAMSTSCELTFNGTVYSSTVTLSTDKKTIYFTPNSSGWPVKLDSVTSINSNSCIDGAGNRLPTQGTGLPVYIADTVTYASASGSDSGTGTDTDPFLTLGKAMSSASASCPGACAIAMKGGTYTVSSSVLMPANISIFGGFDPADWRIRRADKTMLSPYDTVFEDSSVNVSGLATSPYSTFKFNSFTGTAEKSILDGIVIKGPVSGTAFNFGGPLGFANLPAGSGFTVRNTVTYDRSGSANFSSAGFIGAANSGKIILYNSSFSGSGDTLAVSSSRYGIYYNGSSAGSDLTVSSCDLFGGAATLSTAGFFPSGTVSGKITLYQNTVKGGNNSGGDSTGIGIAFSGTDGFTAAENTVSSGTGTVNGYAIYHTSGTGAVISKNKITAGNGMTTSAGIELAGTCSNAVINENEIISTGSGGALIGIRSSVPGTTHILSGNKINFGLWNGSTVKGMIVSGSSQVASNTVTLSGCSGTSLNSTGIESNATFPVYVSNIVSSGDCPNGTSYGFSTASGGGSISISSNSFTSGSGLSESVGIRFSINQGVTLTGNTVSAGTCTGASCFNAGFYSTGSTSGTTLTGNSLTVAPCTGNTCIQSAMQHLSTGSPILTENVFNGGNSVMSTAVVRALNLSAAGGTLKRNTFTVGSGNANMRTVDLGNTASSLKMCANVLVGGTSTSAGNPTTLAIANLSNAAVQFYGNTFIGGQSAGPVDIVAFTSAGAYSFDFKYNLLSGAPGYAGNTNCMNETAAVTYSALDTDNFSTCNTLYLNMPGPVLMTQICAGSIGDGTCTSTLSASPAASNNTNLTPVFSSPASIDYHLSTGTPAGLTTALGAPALASITGSCGDQLDRDGASRTNPSSIGAYK